MEPDVQTALAHHLLETFHGLGQDRVLTKIHDADQLRLCKRYASRHAECRDGPNEDTRFHDSPPVFNGYATGGDDCAGECYSGTKQLQAFRLSGTWRFIAARPLGLTYGVKSLASGT